MDVHRTVLRVGEAAEILGVSAPTVRQLIERGLLTAFEVGAGASKRHLRIPREALGRFIRFGCHGDAQALPSTEVGGGAAP